MHKIHIPFYCQRPFLATAITTAVLFIVFGVGAVVGRAAAFPISEKSGLWSLTYKMIRFHGGSMQRYASDLGIRGFYTWSAIHSPEKLQFKL